MCTKCFRFPLFLSLQAVALFLLRVIFPNQQNRIYLFWTLKLPIILKNCWKIRCNFFCWLVAFFLTILVGELPQFFHMLSRWFITKIWRVYQDAAKYEKHFSRLLRKAGLNFSFSPHRLWNCKKWSWKLIFAAAFAPLPRKQELGEEAAHKLDVRPFEYV